MTIPFHSGAITLLPDRAGDARQLPLPSHQSPPAVPHGWVGSSPPSRLPAHLEQSRRRLAIQMYQLISALE